MANNPALFNAVIAGITGGNQQRWMTENSLADYSIFQTITDVIAESIDNGIDVIDGGATPAQAALLQSICQGVFANRSAHTIQHNLSSVSSAIITLYHELGESLQEVPGSPGTGSSVFSYQGFELDVLPVDKISGNLTSGLNAYGMLELADGYWYSVTVEIVGKNSIESVYYIYRQLIECFRDGGPAVIHYQPLIPIVEFPISVSYTTAISAISTRIEIAFNNSSESDVDYHMYIGFTRKPIPPT